MTVLAVLMVLPPATFSRQLDFKPWPDELPRFYLSTWK
jgi:hypothetical protein